MLNGTEQVQIQKYKTHAHKTPKTAYVQTVMLKHPIKQDGKRSLSDIEPETLSLEGMDCVEKSSVPKRYD